jgi:tRNA-dihydrouridine synthase
MFEACTIRGRRFAPARFAAPMAGYTHSAFRRLLGEWGGCGAVWTEMLAARQLLAEDFQASPWVKRRPGDGFTFYQLMVRAGDPLDRVMDRLGEQGVEAIDLNLACDAFSIRACEAGSGLFEDLTALRRVAQESRRCWPGLLTAKVRLGSRGPDWQARFHERVHLLEESGFDALIVHPRFFEDKFRRRAQVELLPWVATLTRLPLIANGDLIGPRSVARQAAHLVNACGIMIGRMAITRPWLFAEWDNAEAEGGATPSPSPAPGIARGPAPTAGETCPHIGSPGAAVMGPLSLPGARSGRSEPIDHAGVWRRMGDFIAEDFAPAAALRRLQMFAKYYAANFAFGHRFWVEVGNARDLTDARCRGEAFFARSPVVLAHPMVLG